MKLDEIHQPKGCRTFWAFGLNEGTNKKIRKHQSLKEYWNEGNH